MSELGQTLQKQSEFRNSRHGSSAPVQDKNQISRLDGVVFPAGLTELYLMSFCYCRRLFRGVWM
jgi:hypothetical protein